MALLEKLPYVFRDGVLPRLMQATARERMMMLATLLFLLPSLPGFNFRLLKTFRYKASLCLLSPLVFLTDLLRFAERVTSRIGLKFSGMSVVTDGVNEAAFPQQKEFERILIKLGKSGLKSTGNKAHEEFIDWIKNELSRIPGIEVTEDVFDFLRWQTVDGKSLREAGCLTVRTDGKSQEISIAGVVPYSRQTDCNGSSGTIMYLDRKHRLSDVDVQGKIVLRDFPIIALPMMFGRAPGYSQTSDLLYDTFRDYNRPSFAELPIHEDMIDAGKQGAAGIIFLVNLPRSQMDSYWDPHQGTHYHVPAVFVGADEAVILKHAQGVEANLQISAEVSMASTRNVLATLPGQIEETIVYCSHTDGNTYVQENGVVVLLTLAQYFSKLPISARRRTVQFAFNTAHLHVSKEGCGRHAERLDASYDRGSTILAIPVEHMGTREVDVFDRNSGPGKELRFTGQGEVMIWCVGPSPPLVAAVEQAVSRRNLDRVLITRGVGLPKFSRVPTFSSFGGIGTLYHNSLIPTTSLISGPWTLFAPSFGRDAVDVHRLRAQTLAVGDLYTAVDNLSREQVAGGYLDYRRRRAQGVPSGFRYPPEQI